MLAMVPSTPVYVRTPTSRPAEGPAEEPKAEGDEMQPRPEEGEHDSKENEEKRRLENVEEADDIPANTKQRKLGRHSSI